MPAEAIPDSEVLEEILDSGTYARGLDYARTGAVVSRRWNADRTRVEGRVRGSHRDPYLTSAVITRTASHEMLSFHSSCTCPVAVNCKHGVALVLDRSDGGSVLASRPGPLTRALRAFDDAMAARTDAARDPRAASSPAHEPWDETLHSLLDSEPGDAGAQATLGLQFELVTAPGKTRTGDPEIRLRPVLRGATGRWVRSDVSWSNLDYLEYRRSRLHLVPDHIAMMKEVLALSRLGDRSSPYARSDVLNLEMIDSRRLWSLLHDARSAGLPLVEAGRDAHEVALSAEPVGVEIALDRTDTGFRVTPRLRLNGETLGPASSLWIGSSAHGVAWWTDTTLADERTSSNGLRLAPLVAPVDDALRSALRRGPVDVPSADEGRLLRGLIPQLRRRIAVVSDHGTVDLPELGPAILVLMVAPRDDRHLELTWQWSAANEDWRVDLWAGARRDGALSEFETAIVENVSALLSPYPELFEPTIRGTRVAARSHVSGVKMVTFVAECLSALDESPDVHVERLGDIPEYREETDAPVVSFGGAASSDRDWFDLAITVTVGGEAVPFHQLFVALASEEEYLVLPSGTYFRLDTDELIQLARLITEARSLNDTMGADVRVSRFQTSLWEDLSRLGVASAQAAQWGDAVRSLSNAVDHEPVSVPSTLRARLRPYQLSGFHWLVRLFEYRLGGILADDMGLGKTVQALALMAHVRERGLSTQPFLVVAPTSVVANWAAEARRFVPTLSVATVTETQARRGTSVASIAGASDLVITSYGLLRLECDDYVRVEWAGAFLDEAQFLKNHRSVSYRCARSLDVPYKIAMSGTPIENNLMELWSLLSITAPGLFAQADRFSSYYQVPIEKRRDADRLAHLRRRVRPLLLRRTKEQVASDLPDKQEQVLELDLNARHRKVYDGYLHRERQNVLGLLGDLQKNRFAIFRSLTLLRQASLDVSLVDPKHARVPSTKLDALMEMLTDIVDDGHRVLVFSQFTKFLGLARERIRDAGIAHCYLDGRTKNRPAVIAHFRDGDAPVFLISLKAGGVGLNLSEADYCILLDPWWNPATEAQAIDRIHRIGQTRKVMVYRLVAKDTLEEKVMALKARKAALFSDVLEGGGFESATMSADDIRGLLD